MSRVGFAREDFQVFRIGGFSARMNEIYARIRPRLVRLGDQLAPELGRQLHMEFFPHVAKHARRTVNPPPETWTAFGPSPRGYKRYGYLALCISAAGLHARAVVKSEADGRLAMADEIEARAAELEKSLRGTKIARYDHWDFAMLPAEVPASTELFGELGKSLRKKTGGIDLGFGWTQADALHLDRAELLDAFRELEPLYRILHPVV
ncbi:MAG TPA: DUF1054 family protein [Candidatus Binataceae bacterium]|nr:DUF1054 family protein [Candidatus Binataceae bacterium]